MAVAVDTVSTPTPVSNSTISWTHTCSGSDRLLLVVISNGINNNSVTAVSYNAVSMLSTPAWTALPSTPFSHARLSGYYLINPPTGSAFTIAVTMSDVDNLAGGSISFTGGHQTTPLGTPVPATGTTSSASVTVTGTTDDLFVQAISSEYAGITAGQTVQWDIDFGAGALSSGLQTTPGAASTNMTWTVGDPNEWATVGVAVKASTEAATWEQEGYRWRADDGSETTATWLAAQDTNITRAVSLNTRLRVLVDTAIADPASTQVRLDYKKSSEAIGLWRAIGSEAIGALPAYNSAGTLFDNATMPQANLLVNMPAHVAGDLLVCLVLCRNTQNDGLLSSVNGTGGSGSWTLQNNGGSMYGGTQNARIGFGWKVATSSAEAISITTTGGATTDRIHARVYRFTAANGFDAAAIQDIGTPTTGTLSAGQDMTMPAVAAGGANELALCLYGISVTSTQDVPAGSTGATWTEPVGEDTGTNGCTGIFIADDSDAGGVTGGTSASGATSGVWVALGMHLVPATLAPAAIVLAASGNITASGENTTAQLTAPASGSFGGGRIQDDEVLADTVDLALNQYGEWEWCLQAVNGVAALSDIYQFRVTRNGTALDTYTVTPQWTIGTAAAAASLVWALTLPRALLGR